MTQANQTSSQLPNQLRTELREIWENFGFNQSTDVQEQIFQYFDQPEAIVATSPTGSGKTLAYLLPALNRIRADKTLQILVLAPSQELVVQIAGVAKTWGSPLGIGVQAILGGANLRRQVEKLKEKPELIVATPGRFLEVMNQSNKIKIHQLETVIYDEADYLFQAEHQATLKRINQGLMRDVKRIYASATLSEAVIAQAEATPSQQGVVRIEVSATAATDTLSHYYVVTDNREKVVTLKRLAQLDGMQAIVFFEQIHQLEEVAAKLVYHRVSSVVLHSNVSKFEREHAIRRFKNGGVTFLLTTDVASRGIDIPAVPYVVHYNRVDNAETYTHRSGRTGRMGASGIVLSLVNEQELRDLQDIVNLNGITLEERLVKHRQLLTVAESEAYVAEQATPNLDTKVTKKRTPKPSSPAKPSLAAKHKKKKRSDKNKGKRRQKD